ncbi:hypothetical protein CIG19_13395 [Enterobacterales bacterium CwR94]|nr:hypothetical protein CIG19_13395 [Enterobacterales bacterium CwR94]
MGGGRFFPASLTPEGIVERYFDCARYWKINPLTLLDEPFDVLELLTRQGNRIERERKYGGV